MATYSHSKIECFRHCARQYFYRYIARVELEDTPEQVATFLGSRVHDCLEYLYDRVGKGTVPELDALKQRFDAAWKEQWSKDIVIHEPEMTGGDYRTLGWRCVEQYYRRFHPFDQATVIGLEQIIRFPLDEAEKYMMVGYIDRLAKTADGTWQVHDYKTNSRLPTQADKDEDPQLGYYEIGIRRKWKDIQRVELIWHFVRFDTSIVSTRTTEQLRELRASAIETITDIEKRGKEDTAFPTEESALCSYCDYEQICPARKHLYQVRVMPESKLAKEPAVKLVDRWTKLDAQRSQLRGQQSDLETEIEEVRQAIIDLAGREGLELVAGRDKEVVVKRVEKVMFPRKGEEPEEAAELEIALRATKWWKDLSSLNASQLKAAWEDAEHADPALRKLLKPFVWTEQETIARLRARRK